MFKSKIAFSLPLFTVFIGICSVLLFSHSQTAQAIGSQVTMAGLGQTVVPGGSEGDTWDSTWRSDNSVLLMNNDGYGWGGSNTGQHDQLSTLSGTPENPSSISGSNISSFLGSTYSASVYEVDSALYHITLYSNQSPCCTFRHASILKSTNGGTTWINHLGQTNTLTADTAAASTFPSDNWGEVNFVKYGQGGAAPNIDGAQTYVYFSAADMVTANKYYLARVLRSDLSAWTTTFDKTKIQYLGGSGDGSISGNWVSNIASAVSIDSHSNFQSAIVYNYGLDRYIITTYVGNSFAAPAIDSTVMVREAPHPWGPWTEVLGEGVNNKENDNLSWVDLTQKFTSTDGKKMWATAAGRGPYGLQLLPVYLTTQSVQSYEAESAALSGGTSTATSKAGYTGSGYVTGFTAVGAKAQFTASVSTAGAYILKIRYDTNAYQTLGFYLNGTKQGDLKLSKSEQTYGTWTELTLFTWLLSGSNTVAFQLDTSNTGNLNLDNLKLALYSTVPGSLPGANPPGTQTPHGGSNWTLPGTIEAEDYDDGGEGVAFHDSDTVNQGGASYRTDGVDIENHTGGGYDISWTAGGEWLEYTTNIPTGTYNIKANVASASGSGMGLTVSLDGTSLGTMTVNTTGGWQTWQDVTLNNVSVTGGTGKILRLAIVGGSFNINSITFTSVGGSTTVDDNAAGITYTGAWSTGTTAGYYNNTLHYSNTSGNYSQYTFTGTSIQWIGAKNNDHGKVDIYIDGVLDTSALDTYASSWLKQQVLYTKSGLTSGSHTIKILLRSDKNASSSNYYQDVDAFISS